MKVHELVKFMCSSMLRTSRCNQDRDLGENRIKLRDQDFVTESREEPEVFGWSRIPKNTRSRIFFIRLRKSNWIIFYIATLS